MSPGEAAPDDVFADALPGNSVVGWKVDPAQRDRLIAQFPPRYARVVADHVTLKAKVAVDTRLPHAVDAKILGQADDGKGVEAMVVAVDGTTRRPDGGTYHMTWSLEPGRAARESNDVIMRNGWQALPESVTVRLLPALFR